MRCVLILLERVTQLLCFFFHFRVTAVSVLTLGLVYGGWPKLSYLRYPFEFGCGTKPWGSCSLSGVSKSALAERVYTLLHTPFELSVKKNINAPNLFGPISSYVRSLKVIMYTVLGTFSLALSVSLSLSLASNLHPFCRLGNAISCCF